MTSRQHGTFGTGTTSPQVELAWKTEFATTFGWRHQCHEHAQ